MARIAGIELKDNWKVDYALTNIKGVGWSRAEEILKELKIENSRRVSDLSTSEISDIVTSLEKFDIEGELRRKVRENTQRLITIGSYRGIRHNRGLPSRGQRTRSNARTKRGKRRTVGAFKKEALAKMTTPKKEDEK